MSTRAAAIQGSGWAWLVYNPTKKLVELQETQNQDPVLSGAVPLLGIDVWEHAYYRECHPRLTERSKADRSLFRSRLQVRSETSRSTNPFSALIGGFFTPQERQGLLPQVDLER